MKLRRAKEIIRQAKRDERRMGTSFYKTVTDVDTGERKIVPVYQHGMPHADFPNSGTPVSNALAVLTGIASIAMLGYSGIQLQKSLIGNETINRNQKINAAILALGGIAGASSLAPARFEIQQN